MTDTPKRKRRRKTSQTRTEQQAPAAELALKPAKKSSIAQKVKEINASNRYKIRIKRLDFVKASELLNHPLNHRVHPGMQADSLRGLLTDVGRTDVVRAFETEEGLCLWDGHLNKSMEPDDIIPVLVTDLSPEEAAKMLATYDFTTGMADQDDPTLRALLAMVETEDAATKMLLDEIEATLKVTESATTSTPEEEKAQNDLSMQPHEHYDFLLILCRTGEDWQRLRQLVQLPEAKKNSRKGSMGTGRAIAANEIFGLMAEIQGAAEEAALEKSGAKILALETRIAELEGVTQNV